MRLNNTVLPLFSNKYYYIIDIYILSLNFTPALRNCVKDLEEYIRITRDVCITIWNSEKTLMFDHHITTKYIIKYRKILRTLQNKNTSKYVITKIYYEPRKTITIPNVQLSTRMQDEPCKIITMPNM